MFLDIVMICSGLFDHFTVSNFLGDPNHSQKYNTVAVSCFFPVVCQAEPIVSYPLLYNDFKGPSFSDFDRQQQYS